MNKTYVIWDGHNQEFVASAKATDPDLDLAKTFASYEEAEAFAEANYPPSYAILRWM